MDGYVIHPMLVYLLGISENVQEALGGMFSIALLILIVSIICLVLDYDCSFDFTFMIKKHFKTIITIFFISSILFLFFPSKETIIQMSIVSKIKYNTVKQGTEYTKEVIDYLFDKIDDLNKKENKK